MKVLITTALVLLFMGCGSTTHVVLYPNAHLKEVGEVQTHNDIDACSKMADAYVKENPGAKIVGGTIVGGATGALVGGVAGAVIGELGRGSAVGAAAGATAGLIRAAIKASKPSPVYKAYVNRCMKEKGYDPIGWSEE